MKIKLTLIEDALGTASAKKDIQADFISSKAPNAKSAEEEIAAVGVEAYIEKTMTVFPRNAKGVPIFWDYQIKGFMKDSASMLNRVDGTLTSKLKAFRKVIDGLIMVEPRMIPVDFNGGELGNCQRPIRTTGPQGERVALANSETIPAGSSITFEIILFDEDHEDVVTEWLNYGKWRGLAQWRNSGKGRFTWEDLTTEPRKPKAKAEEAKAKK